MRLRDFRRAAWAAWLGLAALGLNALVPVHAAFDFAEALGKASHGLEWRLFALTSGHDHPGEDRSHHDRHPPDCAVCSTAAALAGFAGAPAILLPTPYPIGASAVLVAALAEPDRTFGAAYLSRAPPLG